MEKSIWTRIRRVPTAEVVAASLMFATTVTASAANSEIVAFQGKTTVLTSGFGFNAIPWIGGGGTYGFDTTGTTGGCHELIEAEGSSVDTLNASCDIQVTDGTYTSTACGTGTTGGGLLERTDSATLTDGTGETATITYGSDFVDGVGVIIGNVSEPDGGTATAVGVASITPANGGSVDAPDRSLPGDGPCVTQFLVTGIALSAGASS